MFEPEDLLGLFCNNADLLVSNVASEHCGLDDHQQINALDLHDLLILGLQVYFIRGALEHILEVLI